MAVSLKYLGFSGTNLKVSKTWVHTAILLIVLFSGLWLGKEFVPRFVGGVIGKAEGTLGGRFDVAVAIGSLIVFPIWGMLLLQGRYRTALGMYVLMLPATVRAVKAFAVNAYASPGGYVQQISATTFMLLGFFAVLMLHRVRIRRPERRWQAFQSLLLAFAGIGTVSQFVNHGPYSAFWLSVGGLWQFVALFYIISAVVKTSEDARYVLKCIAGAILIGIIFRMGSFEEPLSPFVLKGEFKRVGVYAFGPAVSYGGYLAFVIILTLYLIQSAHSPLERLVWFGAVLMMVFELLNTFTRGGVLALLFLGLLPIWRNQRRFFRRLLIGGLLLFSFVRLRIIELLTYRGLYFDSRILKLPSVWTRLVVYRMSLPHFFDNLGMGYGIGKSLHFYYSGEYYVSHNLILGLSQEIGGIATILFLALFGYALWQVAKRIQMGNQNSKPIWQFCLVALIAWLFFANTTSTSIVFYYPYEATILFYLVLFLGFVVKESDVLGGDLIRTATAKMAAR